MDRRAQILNVDLMNDKMRVLARGVQLTDRITTVRSDSWLQ